MPYKTDEEISNANSVNLISFLSAQGENLVKSGNGYRIKEHNSLYIQENRWYWNSRSKGGNNIKFVMEYYEKTFPEAVDMLNGNKTIRSSHKHYTENKPPTQTHTKQIISIDENSDQKRAIAYLTKTRHLDYNIISELVRQGKITQDSRNNVVFKVIDEHGNTVGGELVGTSSDFRFKGIISNSAYGYGFEVCKGNGEHALFFESSIDLLSYLQMFGDELNNHRLVSMIGVKPAVVENTIERYGISPNHTFLCVDRDTAGDNFVRRLQSKYPEMHRISTVEPYKDWNEQLSKNNSEKILDFSDLKCYNEGEDEEMNVNTVKTAYTDSIEKITSSSEEWEKFLRFSAELRIPEQEQKHNFSSKLLIYSVNPDVKECRTFSEWKNDNNSVAHGSKGIPILTDNSKGEPTVTHVFDVSQTVKPFEREQSIVTMDNVDEVIDALVNAYGIADYPIENIIAGIVTEETNKLGISKDKEEIVSSSICYEIFHKFGLANEYDYGIFDRINELSVRDVAEIGIAMNSIAVPLENFIENTIITERSNYHEQLQEQGRDRIHLERGGAAALSDVSEREQSVVQTGHGNMDLHSNDGTGYSSGRDWEVREDENDILGEFQKGRLADNDMGEQPVQPLHTDERGSIEQDRQYSREENTVGGIQSGNGRLHENISAQTAVSDGSGRNGNADIVRINNETAEVEEISAFSIQYNKLHEMIAADENIINTAKNSPDNLEMAIDGVINKYAVELLNRDIIGNAEFYDDLMLHNERRTNIIESVSDKLAENMEESNRVKLTQPEPERKQKLSKDGDTIIGNTRFRYIPQKSYTNVDKSIIDDVAKELENRGIKFSGVIKADKATITVSKIDQPKLLDVITEVSSANEAPEIEKNNAVSEDRELDIEANAGENKKSDILIALEEHKDIFLKDEPEPLVTDAKSYRMTNQRITFNEDTENFEMRGNADRGMEHIEDALLNNLGKSALNVENYLITNNFEIIRIEAPQKTKEHTESLQSDRDNEISKPENIEENSVSSPETPTVDVRISRALNESNGVASYLSESEKPNNHAYVYGTYPDYKTASAALIELRKAMEDNNNVKEEYFNKCPYYEREVKKGMTVEMDGIDYYILDIDRLSNTVQLAKDDEVNFIPFAHADNIRTETFDYVERLFNENSPELNIENAHEKKEIPSISVDELKIGDVIKYFGETWEISSINGDFSISLDNLDKTSITPVRAIFGHWKENLEKDGYELISKKDNTIENASPHEPKARSNDESAVEKQLNLFDIAEETVSESMIEWQPIHETEDEKGNPTSYSTKINGNMYFISENPEHHFDVETYIGDGNEKRLVIIDKDFSTRASAEEFFEEYAENNLFRQPEDKAADTIKNAENTEKSKLHEAFERLKENHSELSPEAIKILDRAEKQMEINNYSTLERDVFRLPVFAQTYGMPNRINDNYFDGQLKDIISEVNSYLSSDNHDIGENSDIAEKAIITKEMYDIENAEVFHYNGGSLATINLNVTDELRKRFEENGLSPKDDGKDTIAFETDGKSWNKFVIPDEWGNKTNNINITDMLTPEELVIARDVTNAVIYGEKDMQHENEALTTSDTPQENQLTYNDVLHDRTAKELHYKIPNISDKQVEQLIKNFTETENDGYDWREDKDVQNRLKRLLSDSFDNTTDAEIAFNVIADMMYNYKPESNISAQMTEEQPKTTAEIFEKAGITEESPFIVSPNVERELAKQRELENGEELNLGVSEASVSNSTSIKTSENNPDRFHITDYNLGDGGKKEKFKANVEAIRTLKMIENENRPATMEEKEILSRYVGWGGIQEAFDTSISSWQDENILLSSLLTESEYEAARRSTLDAFYTSPVIIEAMYNALGNMGFDGGNILEPSMGIGNFFGMLPDSMRNDSKLMGVEIDDISGRIARQIYPEADISINGYEKMKFENNQFDLAIGNVPFGESSPNDKTKAYQNLKIHDYFFAKTADKIREGGIMAFVTSSGTLDKQNNKVRKMLAQKCELLGAIRLPNTSFKKNAGTEVTSDIIFLKKREKPLKESELDDCSWINIGKSEEGLPINQYFAENPQMVLGKLDTDFRGNTICKPYPDRELKELLAEAIKNIKGEYEALEFQPELNEKSSDILLATPDIPNYTYTIVDEKLYYRRDDSLIPLKDSEQTGIKAERRKGMCKLADTAKALLNAQVEDFPEEHITALQQQLNKQYDEYVSKYGYLNKIGNKNPNSLFRSDVRFPLLQSLEKTDGEKYLCKADIFTKRTITPHKAVEHTDTSSEALIVSISEKSKVDIDYMAELTGFDKQKIVSDLNGVIYPVPELSKDDNITYQTAEEYLSGNIYEKIALAELAAENNPIFADNITALKNAMPEPLSAGDITIKLGATWIEPKFVQQFMYETFETPLSYQAYENVDYQKNRFGIEVKYSELGSGEWNISNKSVDRNNIMVNANYGTNDYNAYELLEAGLNMRTPKVYRKDKNEEGKEITVLDKKATELANQKLDLIKNAFNEWIFNDPERRQYLVDKYNKIYNCIKPREYDGSYLKFSGMNPEIKLRPHQENAIAHALFGGNSLFAHEVGAGKTFEMIATAMEGKRLGLHNKSLFCVPNHLTEQIGSDFMKLYPNANILVAKPDDFSGHNRRKMCAKIATGNFDAVIIGHSQLIKIPLSPEREQNFIRSQISEITKAIAAASEEDGTRFTVKQMEKTKKGLEEKLNTLVNSTSKDKTVTFEELGIDKLFVDEAHLFKNLFLATKMSNISGISTNDNVQKTQDLYMKCQYLDEITGNRGLTFATGTPVSNSMTEIYSMMKYLQANELEKLGLKNFDSWAALFGDTVTAGEISPEGKYRLKTRFAKFVNVPELMSIFKQSADIKTADVLNLDVPECENNVVKAEPSELQLELIKSLSERAEKVHNGSVDPSVDNMLTITNDGRKIGLDPRLLNPMLPDDPNSKLNLCVNNVFDIWEKTADKRSTQLIFCDLGVPQSKEDLKKNGERFSVYDDIKKKLIEKGIPANEIAFIHDAGTSEVKKAQMFAKVRSGEIRVLIGSTSKMGAGTNVQDKLIASHDLDCPWKPADMTQRAGRMVRQGNENDHVQLFRYVTNKTFDAYLFQTLEKKQNFISQVMTSKSPARTMEDVDEQGLEYAEIKALCAGDPRIKERMELDVEVTRLKMLKSGYLNQKYRLEDSVMQTLPRQIASCKNRIEGTKADIEKVKAYVPPLDEKGEPAFEVTIKGHTYTDKKEAGKKIAELCATELIGKNGNSVVIGEYKGFPLAISLDAFAKEFKAHLKGSITHTITIGTSETGNFQKLDNQLSVQTLETKIGKAETELSEHEKNLERAKASIEIPFEFEEELKTKEARLFQITAELQEAEYGNNSEHEQENPENAEKSESSLENPDYTEQSKDQEDISEQGENESNTPKSEPDKTAPDKENISGDSTNSSNNSTEKKENDKKEPLQKDTSAKAEPEQKKARFCIADLDNPKYAPRSAKGNIDPLRRNAR